MGPGGSAKVFVQPTPVTTSKPATRIVAAFGDHRRIDLTLFIFTIAL